MNKFYVSWNSALVQQFEAENKLDETKTKEIIVDYIKKNKKNRFIDIKPIFYVYENFYKNNMIVRNIKICNIEFVFSVFANTEDFELRDEIKFKLMLESLYMFNISKFKNEFDVDIAFEYEKYSDVYKKCKDEYIKRIKKIEDNIVLRSSYRVHDCVITIANDSDKYQLACEYNEDHHTDEYDDNREKTMKIPLLSFHVKKNGDDNNTYIKRLLVDIIQKCCTICDNNVFLAKMLILENTEDNETEIEYEMLSELLDCIKREKFPLNMINYIFRFSVGNSSQSEFRKYLVNQDILNKKNEYDNKKVSYEIDSKNTYYLDSTQFRKFMTLIDKNICRNYTDILNLYLTGQKALLQATDEILKMEKNNKIDIDNYVGFMNEITIKPLKRVIKIKNEEISKNICCRNIFFSTLKKRKVNKILNSFTDDDTNILVKYKYNCVTTIRDIGIFVEYIGNIDKTITIFKKIIEKYNLSHQNLDGKIIIHDEPDKINDDVIIMHGYVDYDVFLQKYFTRT